MLLPTTKLCEHLLSAAATGQALKLSTALCDNCSIDITICSWQVALAQRHAQPLAALIVYCHLYICTGFPSVAAKHHIFVVLSLSTAISLALELETTRNDYAY